MNAPGTIDVQEKKKTFKAEENRKIKKSRLTKDRNISNINSQPELALTVCIIFFASHKESARQGTLRLAKGY